MSFSSLRGRSALLHVSAILAVLLLAELVLLGIDISEISVQFKMGSRGYGVYKRGSYSKSMFGVEEISPWADWLGLERCRGVLEQNGKWKLTDEQSRRLQELEGFALTETDKCLETYSQIYELLNNEQLEVLMSSDSGLAPYCGSGPEASEIRTVIRSIYHLEKIAAEGSGSIPGFKNVTEAVCGMADEASRRGGPDMRAVRMGNPAFSPVSDIKLPAETGEGFADTPERRHLLNAAEQCNMHYMRLLISLELLCFDSRHKLSPGQAQKILVLIERLRLRSHRLTEVHDAVFAVIPESAFSAALKCEKSLEIEQRFPDDILSVTTLKLTRKALKSPVSAAGQIRRPNKAIPEDNSGEPAEGVPVPKERPAPVMPAPPSAVRRPQAPPPPCYDPERSVPPAGQAPEEGRGGALFQAMPPAAEPFPPERAQDDSLILNHSSAVVKTLKDGPSGRRP